MWDLALGDVRNVVPYCVSSTDVPYDRRRALGNLVCLTCPRKSMACANYELLKQARNLLRKQLCLLMRQRSFDKAH